MSDKKNIDRLFQEKFKDFEAEPNEQIWINIDTALRENKKRRIVPIWFKLTGIAAGLILGFFAFNFLFDDSASVENNQVVLENGKPSNANNSIENPENESVVNTGNSTKNNTANNKDNTVTSSSINQKTNGNNSASENNNTIVNQKSTKTNIFNSGISSEKNNAVATTSAKAEKTSAKKETTKRLNSIAPQNQHNAVVSNQSAADENKKAAVNTTPKVINPKENNALTVETENNSDNNNHKKDLSNQQKQNASLAENQKTAHKQDAIISDNSPAVDGIEKTSPARKDSTAIAVVTPNALEELLKKNEEENTVTGAKMNRWQITSNVAPIYFSSTSNGSPIDAQFAENSKSYENNLSFGVGVNYAVNKKLSVRTGVNKFTLGYSTNDVVFFAAMDKVSFGSVASSDAGSTIQVVSQNNTEALRPFDNDVQNTNEGFMTQRMGYFEVPVEMSYKLIDKKFGVNLIGGMSTLFLNENEVSVSSSTMSASLGKAKNLNDVHFSTNVGVGFRYRFWKSFEANFEPMFKYQINTFNKDAGNFKPYFIGLYSGVSFNF